MRLETLKRENDLILEQLLKEGGEIEMLRLENDRLCEENRAMHEALEKMEGKARHAQDALVTIKQSLSWKLTTPLRSAKRLFVRKKLKL